MKNNTKNKRNEEANKKVISIDVALENAKIELANSVATIANKYGLTAYLLELILGQVYNDILVLKQQQMKEHKNHNKGSDINDSNN
jgi:hypothetical protein